MQGIVTLDFGNSHPNAALFKRHGQQCELLTTVSLNELESALEKFQFTPDNAQLVLSEVKPQDKILDSLQQKGYLLTRLKDYWRGNRFAGMPVQYAETLGEDRLIQAYGTYREHKDKRTLIVDAGTFVTLDIVDESGFRGGYILPGLKAYCESFQQGERLKTTSLDADADPGLPKDSASAMARGYQAFAALAHNLVDQHKVNQVFITGGGSSLWEEFFHDHKPSLHVQLTPNLLHSCLATWFITQIEPL